MKGNYDNVVPYYDLLSRLVFGYAILQAHVFLANAIPANSSILVIGGGTGHILEEISKKNASGLQITYVEISEKMIALSKKRNTGNNEIVFINKSIRDVSFHRLFDVVITPFLFDNFSYSTTKIIFNKIDALLLPKGLWLFADFQGSDKNNIWQKLLLNFMYLFFRLLCKIEAAHLQDMRIFFEEYNYGNISMQTFFKKFIYAAIYIKPGN